MFTGELGERGGEEGEVKEVERGRNGRRPEKGERRGEGRRGEERGGGVHISSSCNKQDRAAAAAEWTVVM